MALSSLRSRLLKPLQTHRTALGSRGDGCRQHAADHVDTLCHFKSQFQQESSSNISSNYLIRPRALSQFNIATDNTNADRSRKRIIAVYAATSRVNTTTDKVMAGRRVEDTTSSFTMQHYQS